MQIFGRRIGVSLQMKKVEFLAVLRKKLAVIEENELNDILDEYDQHITMKTEGGSCTEEEAIAGFGDINQLAAEILEAYHVRSNYEEAEWKEKRMFLAEKSKEYAGKTAGFFTRSIHAAGDFFKNIAASLKCFFQKVFGRKEDAETMSEELELKNCKRKVFQKKTEETAEGESFWCKSRRACGRFFKGCISVLIWCVYLLWNACAALVGGAAGIAAAVTILLLGTLLVLLCMGYPLVGITIMTVGLLMCEGVVAVWAFGLLKKRKSRQEEC